MCRRSYLGDGMLSPQSELLGWGSCDPKPATSCSEGQLQPLSADFGPDPFPYTTAELGGLGGLFDLFERHGFVFDPAANCTVSRDQFVGRLRLSEANLSAVADAIQATSWDGCKARRFARDADAPLTARHYWQSTPRVEARDSTGLSLSGRTCEVLDANLKQPLEWLRMRLEYVCEEDPARAGKRACAHRPPRRCTRTRTHTCTLYTHAPPVLAAATPTRSLSLSCARA
jgi:hypothetical protein